MAAARRRLGLAMVFAVTIASGGACVHRTGTVLTSSNAALRFDRAFVLNGYGMTLHLTRRPQSSGRPLLVYATGDGGWHRKDLDVYRQLVSWDYSAVGFSSPEYLKHLGKSGTTRPLPLARDFEALISFAKANLDLPLETPIILVGVSRGADLAVVAAGQGILRHELAGVVAVGLTKEEEYVRWYERIAGRPRARVPTMLEIYEYLPRLGPVPISVIQSTHDDYLPAAQARTLFGPDTDRRQLHPIESRNHSFTDARRELYDEIRASIAWIDHRRHFSIGAE
jgi:pimeloyl-ACP methyl ester carboxylesterase